jgi:hypothetical protein
LLADAIILFCDEFAHHFGLVGAMKFLARSIKSFTHRGNASGSNTPCPKEGSIGIALPLKSSTPLLEREQWRPSSTIRLYPEPAAALRALCAVGAFLLIKLP